MNVLTDLKASEEDVCAACELAWRHICVIVRSEGPDQRERLTRRSVAAIFQSCLAAVGRFPLAVRLQHFAWAAILESLVLHIASGALDVLPPGDAFQRLVRTTLMTTELPQSTKAQAVQALAAQVQAVGEAARLRALSLGLLGAATAVLEAAVSLPEAPEHVWAGDDHPPDSQESTLHSVASSAVFLLGTHETDGEGEASLCAFTTRRLATAAV